MSFSHPSPSGESYSTFSTNSNFFYWLRELVWLFNTDQTIASRINICISLQKLVIEGIRVVLLQGVMHGPRWLLFHHLVFVLSHSKRKRSGGQAAFFKRHDLAVAQITSAHIPLLKLRHMTMSRFKGNVVSMWMAMSQPV